MTKRSNEYKRNRSFDLWLLVSMVALVLINPDWLGAPDEETPAAITSLNAGDN